uniref:Uncharacterized protein n=1 Tax=viral metagenome TaxID=1070528 RepID=A0A6C0JYK1_9ZZZZ
MEINSKCIDAKNILSKAFKIWHDAFRADQAAWNTLKGFNLDNMVDFSDFDDAAYACIHSRKMCIDAKQALDDAKKAYNDALQAWEVSFQMNDAWNEVARMKKAYDEAYSNAEKACEEAKKALFGDTKTA